MALGALAIVASAIATRGRSVARASAEYEALLARLRAANRDSGLPVGTVQTVEAAAALNAAFAVDLLEMDRQITASVQALLRAKEAATPRVLTIEVIGGQTSGE